MAAPALVRLDVDGAVARLGLERPAALNALDRALTGALEDAVARVASLDAVRVLIVAGTSRAFSAGNDLREMPTLGAEEAEALAARQAALCASFAGLPQVTLAVVDGWALGGGLMLAAAQDLRIASDRSRWGLPEVTLGFNPAYGIARLLDLVGGAHARELLLTGRTIHAQEALRIGLVNRVVAAATLEERARSWAGEIARSPREGLAATKTIVRSLRSAAPGGEPAAREGAELTAREGAELMAWSAALRTGAAARERIAAFLERPRRARPEPAAPSRPRSAHPGAPLEESRD